MCYITNIPGINDVYTMNTITRILFGAWIYIFIMLSHTRCI